MKFCQYIIHKWRWIVGEIIEYNLRASKHRRMESSSFWILCIGLLYALWDRSITPPPTWISFMLYSGSLQNWYRIWPNLKWFMFNYVKVVKIIDWFWKILSYLFINESNFVCCSVVKIQSLPFSRSLKLSIIICGVFITFVYFVIILFRSINHSYVTLGFTWFKRHLVCLTIFL